MEHARHRPRGLERRELRVHRKRCQPDQMRVAALRIADAELHALFGGVVESTDCRDVLSHLGCRSNLPATQASPAMQRVPSLRGTAQRGRAGHRNIARRIGDGLVRLFGKLPVPTSAEEFAKSIGVPRKTLDRHVVLAKLVSGVAIVNAVRVAWGWDLARTDGSGSPTDIARRCGYPSEEAFRSHAQRLLSMPPSELRDAAPTGALLTVNYARPCCF